MRSTSNIRKPGTQLSSNLPTTSTGLKRAVSVQPSQRFGMQSSLQQQQQQHRGGIGSTVTLISHDPLVLSQAPLVSVSVPAPKSARKAPAQSGAPTVTDRIRSVYAAAAQERPDFDNTYAKVTDRPIPKHNIRMDFKVSS